MHCVSREEAVGAREAAFVDGRDDRTSLDRRALACALTTNRFTRRSCSARCCPSRCHARRPTGCFITSTGATSTMACRPVRMARATLRDFFPLVFDDRLLAAFGICDARDVAEAHLKALTAPEAVGQRYMVCRRNACTLGRRHLTRARNRHNAGDIGGYVHVARRVQQDRRHVPATQGLRQC